MVLQYYGYTTVLPPQQKLMMLHRKVTLRSSWSLPYVGLKEQFEIVSTLGKHENDEESG